MADKPDYEGIARVLREHRDATITAEELVAQEQDAPDLVYAIGRHLGLGWQVEVLDPCGDRMYASLEEVSTGPEESGWYGMSVKDVTPEDVEAHCEWIDRVQDAQVALANLYCDPDDPDVQEAQQKLDNADWEYIPDALEALVKAAQAASTD